MMDTYKERIYWHIRRLVVSHEDAEDILQETFINAYRFAGSFNGESRIYTWLYRIATNECIGLFRKNKNNRMEELTDKVVGRLTGNDLENSEEIQVRFQEAILKLPEKQRIVFNLRYYDDLSYEEISLIMNTSVSALKTNYHYAQEKIKQNMLNY
ncbi:MAG: RNA polymerase sigma factor [Bacteroidales bacterium]|nr:RNA polymerase sigma factor [Bacteroidales bacterium]